MIICGFGRQNGPWIEKGPKGGGYDGFGVRWVAPESGAGAAIPAPNEYVLDDITEWKKKINIPDVNEFDWEESAQADLCDKDSDGLLVEYGCGNGIFERLVALMGFENALVSLVLEPEACNEFFAAVTDFKIACAEKVAKYYQPDTFNNYDDIATQNSLFMSPDTYRNTIKPHHKRLYDAVRSFGMIPIQHTCGKAESLIEDFIETGAEAWTSVQPINDIANLLKIYGDRIALFGGYDSNGIPAMEEAPDDIVRNEIRRCIDTYGPYTGYVLFGFRIANSSEPERVLKAYYPLKDEVEKYRLKAKSR